MGCEVKKLDDGQEVEVHIFDTKEKAVHYLTVSRGYTFDRHETWGMTSGFDFYQGPISSPTARAALREKRIDNRDVWSVAFWRTERTDWITGAHREPRPVTFRQSQGLD